MRVLSKVAALVLAAVSYGAVHAQEGPQTVRVIARATDKTADLPVTPATLKLTFNGHDVPVQTVQPLLQRGGQPVEIALLIDDGLRGSFGTQINDIRAFVQRVSSTGASVAVGYMQNGRILFSENAFTSDPDRIAKNLRLPLANGGISGSPYFCLQDAIDHWPSHSGAPRVVLMLTNGIDPYNGAPVPQNQNSPYVSEAIQHAQRGAVPVYSIFYGRFDYHPGVGSLSGQSYLGQVADETGGEMFNQGSINPPSIAPYLQDFERDLRESYLLTFESGAKRGLNNLKIKSTSGAKLRIQKMVSSRG